ncbi:MAG: hypothetical protein ACW99A_19240, partial [Candidatus Kariarchaeaceae archaeon]
FTDTQLTRDAPFDFSKFSDHPNNKNYLNHSMREEMFRKIAMKEAMRIVKKVSLEKTKKFIKD